MEESDDDSSVEKEDSEDDEDSSKDLSRSFLELTALARVFCSWRLAGDVLSTFQSAPMAIGHV